jgi:hypothetical protein
MMVVLRFASLVVLSIWIGGLTVLGALAAPTIFAVILAYDPSAGADLAAQVFGAIFERFQHVSWACGGLLMALLGLRAALGPRPRPLAIRMWTIAAMLAMSLTTSFVIAPRIDAIRRGTPGRVADLSPDDGRRVAFGRLHAASTGIMLATLLAGLGLLWAEARDTH